MSKMLNLSRYYVHKCVKGKGWFADGSYYQEDTATGHAKHLVANEEGITAVLVKDQDDRVVYDSRKEDK